MNFLSLLFPQTIYKTSSKFSGEIKVIDHAFERRLVVGGLTQSGGITKDIWKKAFKKLEKQFPKLFVKNILILGLAAGTIVEIVNKKWPGAEIAGIEIDEEMIGAGKKCFYLNKAKNLEIIIGDAIKIIENQEKILGKKFFDVIIVDLYKGFFIEKNVENNLFLQKITQKLSKNGVLIFNVVKPQNNNFEANIFLDKLRRIFKDNFCRRIISNDIIFCATPRFLGMPSPEKEVILSMAAKKKKKKKK